MSTFRSFAKLNLHLEVAGRRADGYHELRTLFSTIDLADELEIELTAGGVTLETGRADLPAGRENLVVRAAEAFLAAVGGGVGASIRLLKRIPVGGGLGGGSANAATTLRGLALMTGSGPSEAELERIARSLGADVPFFLHGGLALGLGRGDEIRPLPDLHDPLELWLALPSYSVSTAEAFRAFPAERARAEPSRRVAALLAGGSIESAEGPIGENDLEAAVFGLRPELGALYTQLVRSRARVVRMSGSGSTLFAVFEDPDVARAAGIGLPPGTAWFPVRTLGRAEWHRASGYGAAERGG